MNLPAFCIRRPAFTIVISLVMTIVGLIGFMNLPIRYIPNVSLPIVTIMTNYSGANARLVEQDITKVLEDSLSGINGMKMLTSRSRQGNSQISVQFKLGTPMNTAVEDVRSSIERVRGSLPKEADNPVVVKADTTNMPILFLSFYDTHKNARELSDYIVKYIVPSFETIDGVGNVFVYGKRLSAIRVALDPQKMAGAKVTADEVTQLLHDQNVSIPSGQIRGLDRYYSVITDTTLKTAEQFNELIIRDQQNQVIRLKDIGETTLAAEDTDSTFRVNGRSAIALGVVPQSTANPLEVEQQVQKKLADLKRTLPAGMQVSIDYNQADYIRASMHSVYESLFEAVLFVWIVILAFLCSFRATLIPIVTIPVCLISTFALLYFMGFSINTITLMALVLAIGLVVDDAIVMLENIKRHMDSGLSAYQAALRGSREIVFPIIAMTITLAAVYAPIAFTPGLLGVLFREFTFTLAGAVIISGIIALTLSPMMCARLLKTSSQEVTQRTSRYEHWLTAQLARLQQHYQRLLCYFISKRKWVMSCLLLMGVVGLGVYKLLPQELAPTEDRRQIEVYVAAPRSASFTYTDSYVRQLESLYASIPDIENYFSQSGTFSSSHAYQQLSLKPKDGDVRSTKEVVADLLSKVNTISGVRVNVATPSSELAEFAGSDNGEKIGLVIMTSNDYLKLQGVVANVMDAIKQIPGFTHVDNRLKWDSEEFQINIDRERAADLKVNLPQISTMVSTLLAGRTIGKTNDTNIIVQMNEKALADPNIFQQLYVRNANGNMVSLSHLVTISENTTPEVFHHFERLRADTIFVNVAPDFSLAEAIRALQHIAQDHIPDDMKYTFTGEAKSFLESNGKTVFTFMLALLFIYLVLVAQFESFIDPLIILLTVPFALVGALLTLKLFGGSLNIYSNIGLITLIGLIAKHGILITEFANRLRAEGKSISDAVIEASLLRLRPILMTTAAMVLGALPLAFAVGPGAESRQQIGLVIAGGLLLGTFFSLVVVPIGYTYLAPLRKLTLNTQYQE